MANVCHGKTGGNPKTDGEHCCYVDGVTCPHLIDAEGVTVGFARKPRGREKSRTAGRRFSCALRVELGSWAAVHADPRYLADVQPAWAGAFDCGDWGPASGECCFAQDQGDNDADAVGVTIGPGPGHQGDEQ